MYGMFCSLKSFQLGNIPFIIYLQQGWVERVQVKLRLNRIILSKTIKTGTNIWRFKLRLTLRKSCHFSVGEKRCENSSTGLHNSCGTYLVCTFQQFNLFCRLQQLYITKILIRKSKIILSNFFHWNIYNFVFWHKALKYRPWLPIFVQAEWNIISCGTWCVVDNIRNKGQKNRPRRSLSLLGHFMQITCQVPFYYLVLVLNLTLGLRMMRAAMNNPHTKVITHLSYDACNKLTAIVRLEYIRITFLLKQDI